MAVTADAPGAGRSPGEGPRSAWSRRVRDGLATHPRIGLSVKAAVSGAAAWALVQLLPGPAAEYPYYAPLGAVIATSTTLAGSARESFQAVGAITLGAAVALVVDALAGPNVVTIAAVIGIGVLLAGWRRLGGASTWLPTAALFVLIIGSDNPIPYVAGFAGLTLLGALVGLAVTAAFPPLPLTPAKQEMARLREILAGQLDDLVTGLQQPHPPTSDEWRARMRTIDPVLTQMRTAVGQADEARRGNRLAKRYRHAVDQQYHQARALERVTLLVEDLTHLIAETEIADNEHVALGPALRPAAARALDRLAHVLRSVEGAVADADATRTATEALQALAEELERARATTDEDLFAATSIVEAVRRALAAIVPEERPTDRDG